MDIVYAAEKTSIAALLGEHLDREVAPGELRVSENPAETGSFYVGWQFARFVLSPDGSLRPDVLPGASGRVRMGKGVTGPG